MKSCTLVFCSLGFALAEALWFIPFTETPFLEFITGSLMFDFYGAIVYAQTTRKDYFLSAFILASFFILPSFGTNLPFYGSLFGIESILLIVGASYLQDLFMPLVVYKLMRYNSTFNRVLSFNRIK